jgi:cystathionine beta-lyase
LINATGIGLPPFDCFLLIRGVKTLSVRLEKQQANSVVIANFLYRRGFKTHYPGLPSFQWNDVHFKQAQGGGAVLSFETGSVSRSEQIVEGTRIFGISVSFGCVNSLVSMPCRMSHASIPAHVRKERALPEDLIRLCVGIEDVRDLVEDLGGAIVSACGGITSPYVEVGRTLADEERLVEIDDVQRREVQRWKAVNDADLVMEIAKEFSVRL